MDYTVQTFFKDMADPDISNEEVYGSLMGKPKMASRLSQTIPLHMQEGIIKWVGLGIPSGAFLQHIIKSEYDMALLKADQINRSLIAEYETFFYKSTPALCHGSVEKHDAWVVRGGLIGIPAHATN